MKELNKSNKTNFDLSIKATAKSSPGLLELLLP